MGPGQHRCLGVGNRCLAQPGGWSSYHGDRVVNQLGQLYTKMNIETGRGRLLVKWHFCYHYRPPGDTAAVFPSATPHHNTIRPYTRSGHQHQAAAPGTPAPGMNEAKQAAPRTQPIQHGQSSRRLFMLLLLCSAAQEPCQHRMQDQEDTPQPQSHWHNCSHTGPCCEFQRAAGLMLLLLCSAAQVRLHRSR